MTTNETFKVTKEILSRYPKEIAEVGLRLRDFLLDSLIGLIEQPDESAKIIGFGYGEGYKNLICTIMPSKTGIKLGFYKGGELADPDKILTGSGKVHRYVQIKSVEDIASPVLRNLLQLAVIAHYNRRNK